MHDRSSSTHSTHTCSSSSTARRPFMRKGSDVGACLRQPSPTASLASLLVLSLTATPPRSTRPLLSGSPSRCSPAPASPQLPHPLWIAACRLPTTWATTCQTWCLQRMSRSQYLPPILTQQRAGRCCTSTAMLLQLARVHACLECTRYGTCGTCIQLQLVCGVCFTCFHHVSFAVKVLFTLALSTCAANIAALSHAPSRTPLATCVIATLSRSAATGKRQHATCNSSGCLVCPDCPIRPTFLRP